MPAQDVRRAADPAGTATSAVAAHVAATDPHGDRAATLGKPLALTGATQATRYVGATTSGAPATGTFAVGDFVISQAGKVYVCTTAGSPGTWKTISDDASNSASYMARGGSWPLTTGEAALPREVAGGDVVAAASGQMLVTVFQARKTESITQVAVTVGPTAAAATPSVCRLGVFSIAANGDATLIHSTANDTALFASTNTEYAKALDTTWAKVAGSWYGIGVLVVSATTMPKFTGLTAIAGVSSLYALAPRLVFSKAGLSDLPASVAVADQAAQYRVPNFRLIP